jgi:phage-related protein
VNIRADVQTLDPGPKLEFWELDATEIGGGIVRFQGHNDGIVFWQGNEYAPWPITGEGFARTSDQQPQPKLVVGNVDGSISQLCMLYEDMVGARIVRRRTFAKYLDAVNFPAGPIITPGGGQFESAASISDWTITVGNVSALGDGKLRIGRPGGVSAIHFTFESEADKLYDLTMFVLDEGGTPGATIRAGTSLNGSQLGLVGIAAGGGGGFQFMGTGGTVFVQVFRNGTSNQAVVDYVNLRLAGGNPTADPNQEFPPEMWFIERKSAEAPEAVEFELASALDFLGKKLPGRQIIAGQCPAEFVYRGENCGYAGPPVADINDVPTDDPLLDRCGKRLRSCKLRQWPDGVLNYGGYPAAGLVRT